MQEVRRLRKQLEEAEKENQFLKKAAAREITMDFFVQVSNFILQSTAKNGYGNYNKYPRNTWRFLKKQEEI